jgi:hypothetical protein
LDKYLGFLEIMRKVKSIWCAIWDDIKSQVNEFVGLMLREAGIDQQEANEVENVDILEEHVEGCANSEERECPNSISLAQYWLENYLKYFEALQGSFLSKNHKNPLFYDEKIDKMLRTRTVNIRTTDGYCVWSCRILLEVLFPYVESGIEPSLEQWFADL